MSKSYNNIVPILSSEKDLKKSIMSIVTNSQEPGEKKDWKDNTLFSIYSSFAADNQIKDMKHKYEDGIGWGDAKNIVFNDLNDLIKPIRDRYLELESRKSDTEEILQTNAKEVRTHTQSLIKKVKEFVGIKKL